jgi:hypothetical protein
MSLPISPYRVISFPDEEITWAGECPWNSGFCFGTVSGKLLFQDESDKDSIEVKLADEAINDVAFWKHLVGVSTPSEVLIYTGPLNGDRLSLMTGDNRGAHGIIATPRGRFLAPMGTEGLFCFDGELGPQGRPWIERSGEGDRNYYKVAYLNESEGREILACATRSDGLARIRLDADNPQRVFSLAAPSLDIIDVTSLRSVAWPFAAAGLGLDRSLILVRDILALDGENPERLRFDHLRGSPYSVLCVDGHIFLLTSKELVILPQLGSRFLDGEPLDTPLHAYHSETQAVEAFIVGNKRLMVVTDEGIRFADILRPSSFDLEQSTADKGLVGTSWCDIQETPRHVPATWTQLVA